MIGFDLEDRLVDFAVSILAITKEIPNTIQGNNLIKQLSKSGTSVALHYGEAQAAESRKDFIHKMKVVLKELRETSICLKLLNKAKLLSDYEILENIQEEKS